MIFRYSLYHIDIIFCIVFLQFIKNFTSRSDRVKFIGGLIEHADGASVITPIARAASTRCRDTTLAPDWTVLVTIDWLKKLKNRWIKCSFLGLFSYSEKWLKTHAFWINSSCSFWAAERPCTNCWGNGAILEGNFGIRGGDSG